MMDMKIFLELATEEQKYNLVQYIVAYIKRQQEREQMHQAEDGGKYSQESLEKQVACLAEATHPGRSNRSG